MNKKQKELIHWRTTGPNHYGYIYCDKNAPRELSKHKIKNSSSIQEITCTICGQGYIAKLESKLELAKERLGFK